MNIIYKHDTSRNIHPNSFRVHTHADYEVFFMLGGKGVFVVEGNTYPISPNSVMLLRPGEMHRAVIESGLTYERCYFHFSEAAAAQMDPTGRLLPPFKSRLLGRDNYYGPGTLDTGFIKRVIYKVEEVQTAEPDNEDVIQHYLFVILHEIYRSYQARVRGDSYPLEYDEQMYEIIQYINKNICGDLSLTQIEKRFFISRPSLSKRFKQATGTTVWDYILTKRVVMANQLIRNGERVTAAAFSCGFTDYSSFYRAYRKIYNCAPQADKK